MSEEGPLVADIPLPAIGDTASGRAWRLREADLREAAAIARAVRIDPVAARVLAARGVTHETARAYLEPALRDMLPDPFVLKDMREASARISRAIINNEPVGVFGDYDVDGTSAAAILKNYFHDIGAPLEIYLPDRLTEGYGPSLSAFRQLKERGVRLIITVDCGAAAHDIIEDAAAEDLDIVVLDHHLMQGAPPPSAAAIVNPNREDDQSGLNNLSAAGVAFMAVAAVQRELRETGFFKGARPPNILRLLDLTALGLVCDVMDMTGLTRVLVAQGLKVLNQRANPGLSALADCAGAKPPYTPYHLGFLLGPRINAAGRIGHAQMAFDLLTNDDPASCVDLAERLHILNQERQMIEERVQEEAISLIESGGLHRCEAIVAAGQGWHPGVIGIVAGRLKERYGKPVIVIGVEDGVGKGSGRSIKGVDLGGAISALKQEGMLVSGGGHAMAAGLTINNQHIIPFTEELNKRLGEVIQRARKNLYYEADALIAPSAVSKGFSDMIDRAGPFGPGNPEPQFVLSEMLPDFVKTVGKNHISLVLKDASGNAVRAIAFRAEGEPLGALLRSERRIHLLGKVRADDWRGGDYGQFQITDAAPAL